MTALAARWYRAGRMDGDHTLPTGVHARIRRARRPPGWQAPGPPPRTPCDRPDIWPQAGEDLCHLAGDWRILQRCDGHRWSLDDLVTAWFAARECAIRPPARFTDLGCGIGTVLLLLAWWFPEATGEGIEAQTLSADLARRSIVWNGVETRLRVRIADLRTLTPADGPADLVTGTPPYLLPGTATASRRPQRAPATIEERGGIEAYAAAAARLLTPDGVFVVCEQARQSGRVARAAGAAGLAITRAMEVIPREGKAPLFSVFAMRRTTSSVPERDAPLVVRDRRGRRTAACVALRAAAGMPP